MPSFNGGPGRDSLTGTAGADTITGYEDNDRLIGAGGNDTLDGGAGDDLLFGDNNSNAYLVGDDHLSGGDGNDELVGGLGHVLLGGAGDDEIYNGTAYTPSSSSGLLHNTIQDGGNDRIDGGAGVDTAVLVYMRNQSVVVDISNPDAVSVIYSEASRPDRSPAWKGSTSPARAATRVI